MSNPPESMELKEKRNKHELIEASIERMDHVIINLQRLVSQIEKVPSEANHANDIPKTPSRSLTDFLNCSAKDIDAKCETMNDLIQYIKISLF